MAIRGVNLAEKETIIHPDDPGHPDQITARIDKYEADEIKAGKRKTTLGDAKRDELATKFLREDPPTKYLIGNLTASDRVEFGDMSATPTMRDGGITMDLRNIQKAYEVVRRGLKGWENQLDSEGNPITFKKGTGTNATGGFAEIVHDECMMHLPQSIIIWLSGEIQKKNGMMADLAKKSDVPSQLPDDLSSAIGTVSDAQMTINENEGA